MIHVSDHMLSPRDSTSTLFLHAPAGPCLHDTDVAIMSSWHRSAAARVRPAPSLPRTISPLPLTPAAVVVCERGLRTGHGEKLWSTCTSKAGSSDAQQQQSSRRHLHLLSHLRRIRKRCCPPRRRPLSQCPQAPVQWPPAGSSATRAQPAAVCVCRLPPHLLNGYQRAQEVRWHALEPIP